MSVGHASEPEPSTSTQIPPATIDRLVNVTRGSDIDRLRINEVGGDISLPGGGGGVGGGLKWTTIVLCVDQTPLLRCCFVHEIQLYTSYKRVQAQQPHLFWHEPRQFSCVSAAVKLSEPENGPTRHKKGWAKSEQALALAYTQFILDRGPTKINQASYVSWF